MEHTFAVNARLTSSRFVGRISELAELELALRDAREAHPRIVLLGGESGIGKTRLVSEFVRRLDEQGHEDAAASSPIVLRGEALEQRDGELPYAPLLAALRPLARERSSARYDLNDVSPQSRAELATLLPAFGSEGAFGGRDAHDPGGQLRLFEAVLELLDALSSGAPIVFVLEDMHWADRSTRALTEHLARNLRTERVLLLLSYRTDELHRRHALRPLLAELQRLECTRRIELQRLDRAELREFLEDILGEPPDGQLVERLFTRSEGNPLYTEELLAAGLDGRGGTPRTLRDAFLMRIERLPADSQRVARAIAVGRRLDSASIEAVTGFGPERLNDALREAVSAQVLIAGEDDRFSFRHALLGEALYDDLLPGERAERHLALARTLEQQTSQSRDGDAELAASIAAHYAAAGDQPAALQANVRAARAAQGVHAYGEAADLAERALELWPRVADAEQLAGLDHVGLVAMGANAHGLGGDRGRAEVLLREALRELDPDRDPHRYSTLLGRLAWSQWALNRGPEAVETAERALALLPSDERSSERALLLSWLARTRFLRGRFREAVRDGEEALAAAVALGDQYIEVESLNTLGMARIGLREVDQGVSLLRRAIEIARADDDLPNLASAYGNLADMLAVAGRTEEALLTAEEGLATIPRRLRDLHYWLMLTVSELAFELGDWRTSRDHLDRLPSRLDGRLLIFRLLREADQALGEGDEDAAARYLSEVEPLVAASTEPQWIAQFGALRAELKRRQHELEGAREAVRDALDRIELCTDDVMRVARVTAVGLVVEADRAQLARDLRERAPERDAQAHARIHMDRLKAVAEEGGPIERAWLRSGTAEYGRGRGRNDAAKWAAAAREWDRLRRPYRAALARLHEAEAQVEAGAREAAAEAAAAGLATAQTLGARWLVRELTALAGRARLALAETDEAAAPGKTDGAGADEADAVAGAFGLTPRERQVLALLAEGATNRQIGKALYMAEKTASVHVSRILSKLGVHTRTQAAALAHRQHLDARP